MRQNGSVGSALAVALVAAVGASAGACHSHSGGPGADEYNVDCEVPGGAAVTASDEDFRAFIDAEKAGGVKTSPADSLPRITTPESGASVSATSPPTFTLVPRSSLAAGAPGRASGDETRSRARTLASRQPRERSLWQRFRAELTLEREAHAHCPPSSGEKYLLRVTSQSGEAIYTAVVTVPIFTPRADVWSSRLSAHKGATVNVTLLRATFVDAEIGEGPYAASPATTLTVGP